MVSNPMLHENFELHAGTSGFPLLQNIVDGSQPIAFFNSLYKSIKVVGGPGIPNFYDKHEIDATGDELSSLNLNT